MIRRLVLCALSAALVGAAPAAALTPVKIAPWHTIDDHDQSVDNAGRGVVVFPHGDHVWVAATSPAGRLVTMSRIDSPPTGPNEMVAVQNDAGDVLAGNVAFTGQKATGVGSARQPWTTRFAWGRPPPPSRFLSEADADAESLRAAMRADGTVALAWTQRGLDEPGVPYVAVLPKEGTPTVTAVKGIPDATPSSLFATTGGEFLVGWELDGSRLAITRVAAGGQVGAPEPIAGHGRSDARPRILVNAAGDQAVVWQDEARGEIPSVRTATRRAGAPRFATQVVARGRDRYVDAALGADGTAAVLLRRTAIRRKPPRGAQSAPRLRVVRRGPDGALAAPVELPGRTFGDAQEEGAIKQQAKITVAGDGSVVVAYDMLRRRTTAARVVRISPSGALRGLATVPECSPLGLAGAASGAGLLTMVCPRPYGKRSGEKQGGSVLTIPAP